MILILNLLFFRRKVEIFRRKPLGAFFSTTRFRRLYFLHKPCSFHPLSNGGKPAPSRSAHTLFKSLLKPQLHSVCRNLSITLLNKLRKLQFSIPKRHQKIPRFLFLKRNQSEERGAQVKFYI